VTSKQGNPVSGSVLAVLLFVFPALAAEETRVEVLAVRSRRAEDLAAAVRPMAGAEGQVVAAEGRLVVRASPAALAEIKRALESLDPPPRPLWITVDQDTGASTTGRSAEFTVETQEDGVVERRTTRTLVGGSVSADPRDTISTSTEPLHVLEGHRAFIRMSRGVPVPSNESVSSAGGTVLAPGKTYADGDLAFSVVPRLVDDQVTLEITSTDDTVDGRGARDVQRTQSTVSGRLGEWLNVGEAIRSASLPSSGILSADQRLSEVRTLLVKIDDAR
jgi:Bacterial type II/III secretion system short domain